MKPSDVDVPDGWEHTGWVDEHGNLWSLLLRTGDVESDRPVFAPPLPNG